MKLLRFNEDHIDDKIVEVLVQIDEHAVQTNDKLADLSGKIDKVIGAFPEGDFEGHKRYHQTMIEILTERRKLRAAIQEKTISGLVWAAIVGVGVAVWHELLSLTSGSK